MLKKFVFFMMIIVTSVFTGCNSNNIEYNNSLEDEIVVYTTYSEEIIKYIADKFNNETGIKVNYEIVEENSIENIDKNDNVDFILGGDKSIYSNLSSKNILKPFKTSWFSNMNEEDVEKDGAWYAVSKNPILLVYNSNNLLPQNAPKSWVDLANGIYRDKIVMESTNKDYVKNILASLMYQYYKSNNENAGIQFYQELKNNILSFEKSEKNLYKALNNKETPIGITTLSSYIKNNGTEQKLIAVNTTEGSPVVYHCAAILNNAKHPNASELFMEFVAGPKMQVELSKKFNILPTQSEAVKYGGDWMKYINKLKIMDVDWNIVLENRNKWVNIFKSVQKGNTDTKEEIKPVKNTKKS